MSIGTTGSVARPAVIAPPTADKTELRQTARVAKLKAAFMVELGKPEWTGRTLSCTTFAEMIAVCLVISEDEGGSRGALLDSLRPKPENTGGFDPLWGQASFELVTDRNSEGIKCLRCDNTSFHPEDVRHRYCGYCHEFHDGR